MTVENTIKRYKEFVLKGDTEAANMLKTHMLAARKYQGHPFLNELKPQAVESKEKDNGKKSKRRAS